MPRRVASPEVVGREPELPAGWRVLDIATGSGKTVRLSVAAPGSL